ncbi:hypothetical protein CPB83DRAFT_840967 [Crepidotus variabilis]|uniref:Uncharacterized protein n=1 Tax=Crepidotus variabilis TaxID=179855 RepID=A0A9P6E3G7_9AGAR|nr:hypothetical protein CPB83DRAFT_840967 [Crepidotus variabilis]
MFPGIKLWQVNQEFFIKYDEPYTGTIFGKQLASSTLGFSHWPRQLLLCLRVGKQGHNSELSEIGYLTPQWSKKLVCGDWNKKLNLERFKVTKFDQVFEEENQNQKRIPELKKNNGRERFGRRGPWYSCEISILSLMIEAWVTATISAACWLCNVAEIKEVEYGGIVAPGSNDQTFCFWDNAKLLQADKCKKHGGDLLAHSVRKSLRDTTFVAIWVRFFLSSSGKSCKLGSRQAWTFCHQQPVQLYSGFRRLYAQNSGSTKSVTSFSHGSTMATMICFCLERATSTEYEVITHAAYMLAVGTIPPIDPSQVEEER